MLNQSDDELRPKLGKYYLLGLSMIIIVILIIYFVVLKVNPTEYFNYLLKLNSNVMNEKLMQLNNANTLYNLPNVTLQTNNTDIDNLVDCKNKIKYIGSYTDNNATLDTYRNLCKNTCGGAGELIMAQTDTDYVYNNEFVKAGIYCTVDPVPCNMNTGYAVATVNSVKCNSKYPKMFGGPSASNIIACNDEKYPSTGSVLWDYANNEKVDPLTVVMTDEDEKLPDGSYRFRCKFNETLNGNPYIEHPLDRFHPITDKCNDMIYKADYSVHANITETDWSCDCGDFDVTRVKHLDENDTKSICTSCYRSKNNNIYKIPYICFKEQSPYSLPKINQPCIEYDTPGNSCNTIDLKIDLSSETRHFINTKVDGEIKDSEIDTYYQVYNNI
ncbi:PIF-2 [Carcinus maenas nudivirus]|uniref:PIF-2 n=1 Tax=Carcinus maenas nudivirus TaxID=2880837 RepID=A0AAE8Y291_9VIRU|nr:PIF-2 [Carcinus maenas nudivirus]UBZ25599.1 PIF-2 [Carcinus maenas nudivirus]